MFIYINVNGLVCLSAVIYLFIVTFLQWDLALVSHLHPVEIADTALTDIHQHPSMTRRSKSRCQCLPFRDLGPLVRLAPGLALLADTPQSGSGNSLVSLLSFFYCSGQQDPDESVRPATYTQLRNELKGAEGGSTFMLPARAFVCLSRCPSIPGKRDAIIFIWLQI